MKYGDKDKGRMAASIVDEMKKKRDGGKSPPPAASKDDDEEGDYDMDSAKSEAFGEFFDAVKSDDREAAMEAFDAYLKACGVK